MFKIRDISIKNKLVLMQVFTSVIALGIGIAAFVIIDIKGFKDRKVLGANTLAQVIGSNSISDLEFLDNAAVKKILSALSEQNDILNATVLDKNGNIFASYTKFGTDTTYHFSVPPNYEKTFLFTNLYLFVNSKIQKNNETVGHVCIRFDLSELNKIKMTILRLGFLLVILGIGIAFLIAVITQRYISKPLLSLVSVMQVVKDTSNYKIRSTIEGEDEIGMLSLGFNNMLSTIETRTTELEQSKEKLNEQNSLLQSVINNMGDGLVVADKNGKFILWNSIGEKMIGVESTNIPQEKWAETFGFFLTDTQTHFNTDKIPLIKAINGEDSDNIEMYIKNPKSPEGVFINANARPLKDLSGTITGGVLVFHDITERKGRESALQKKNNALTQLFEKLKESSEDFNATLNHIIQASADAMNVGRVSIWLYDDLKSGIKCIDLFERNENKHSSGVFLSAKDYPSYFKALEQDRVIDANNTQTDLRTSELSESYFTPLGINSMLDAPIRIGGKMIGVVCHEQLGPQRTWTDEEKVFAGAIADTTAIAIESSKRIKAQEELSNREELLSSIYDTVGDIIFVLSVEKNEPYRFISVNKTFFKATGLTTQQIVGKRVDEVIPQSAIADVLNKYKEAIRDKKTVHWEETSDYPTGKLIGEVSIAPVFDEEGNCTTLVGAVHDITERKIAVEKIQELNASLEQKVTERTTQLTEANENLGKSEVKYRKMVEEVGDVVYSSDDKGYFTYINPACVKLTGYTQNELVGKHFSELIAPEWKERAIEFYLNQFKNRVDETIFSFPIITKSGEQKWVEQTVTQLIEGDRITGYRSIVRDISERKAAEYQLKQKSDELEKNVTLLEAANKELNSFSYTVAHDLKAPLRAINGFSLLLKKSYEVKLDDSGKELLNTVIENSTKMSRLIEDLLEFSKMQKREFVDTDIDMEKIAKEVYDELIKNESGRIIDFKINTLPHTSGDYAMIKQIWTNLISNALKYTRHKEKTEISIGSQSTETENIYFIKDNGAGFDMAYVNKLFGVFQRLHSANEFEGNGIGLAIIKRIIDRYKGRVWAEGKVNEGASFYFTLLKNK